METKLSKEEKEELIQEVLDYFDFEHLLKVLTESGYRYRDAKDPSGIPTLEEMKEIPKHLLSEAVDNQTFIIEGDSFEAIYSDDGELSLRFILMESSAYL